MNDIPRNYIEADWLDRAFMFLEDGRRHLTITANMIATAEAMNNSPIPRAKDAQMVAQLAISAGELANAYFRGAQVCQIFHEQGYRIPDDTPEVQSPSPNSVHEEIPQSPAESPDN